MKSVMMRKPGYYTELNSAYETVNAFGSVELGRNQAQAKKTSLRKSTRHSQRRERMTEGDR